MKKVTLICLARERDRAVERLGFLGAMHVGTGKAPSGEGLEKARRRLERLNRALEILPDDARAAPTDLSVPDVVERVWDLVPERMSLLEELDRIRAERARVEPFGEFDPLHVLELERKGVSVLLCTVGPKQEVPRLEGEVVQVLSRDSHGTSFAVIHRKGVESELPEYVDRMPLPERSLSTLDRNAAQVEARLASIDRTLAEHAGDRAKVEEMSREARDRVRYLEIRQSMGVSEEVAWLEGFLPEDAVQAFEAEAKSHGWGWRIVDPAPEDEPPTLIRNPRWVRPIGAVFDMIGLTPGYEEKDISAVFLLFLSLFFAMLVGDAGYGAIFLALTLLGRVFLKKVPSRVWTLLFIMSGCTMVWGVLTGTYFGIEELAAPLARLKVEWLTGPVGEENVMLLCFFIGAVHLTIAHGWRMLASFPSLRALAQLGWICTTWTMFYAARTMVLLEPFPQYMFWVLGAGVVLIALFMTPFSSLGREWFNHVMLPLNIISNFVDVISYVRLFAVGAATFAVASAFNSMALDMGFDSVFSGLAAALVIFVGHTLNILLASMGVLVHGVRLNTLEYAGHMGLQWTGRRYDPFTLENAPLDGDES